MFKKILAFLMVLSMLFGFFPLLAFADDYVSHVTNFWDAFGIKWAKMFNAIELGEYDSGISDIIASWGSIISHQVCSVSEDYLHHTSNATVHGSGSDPLGPCRCEHGRGLRLPIYMTA